MTTSTLPCAFRALDSDTDLITLDTTGVTFGVATALTAVTTALSSAQYAAVFAGTNQAAYGTLQLITLVVNGVSVKVPAFVSSPL